MLSIGKILDYSELTIEFKNMHVGLSTIFRFGQLLSNQRQSRQKILCGGHAIEHFSEIAV